MDSGRFWPLVLGVFMMSFNIGINDLYTIEKKSHISRPAREPMSYQNVGASSIRRNAFMQRCASAAWCALSQPTANHARGSVVTASR